MSHPLYTAAVNSPHYSYRAIKSIYCLLNLVIFCLFYLSHSLSLTLSLSLSLSLARLNFLNEKCSFKITDNPLEDNIKSRAEASIKQLFDFLRTEQYRL